ncbi:MAG: hypothetical protein H0T78_00800 [Longispora sp.]|nr:hypothetical protein [Longispora sp. (in: high G+C Gram-positive bacteria)]
MRRSLKTAATISAFLAILTPAGIASAAPHQVAPNPVTATNVFEDIIDLFCKRKTFGGRGGDPEIALTRARRAMWNDAHHCEEVRYDVNPDDDPERAGQYVATVFARCHRLI